MSLTPIRMNGEKEYWLFADESVQHGKLFCRFLGGGIAPATKHAVEAATEHGEAAPPKLPEAE